MRQPGRRPGHEWQPAMIFFADSTQDWPGNSYPGLDPEQLSRDERNYWQILNGVAHIDAAGGDETPANAVLYEQAAR